MHTLILKTTFLSLKKNAGFGLIQISHPNLNVTVEYMVCYINVFFSACMC